MTSDRIPTLDGLRALAIGLVLASHGYLLDGSAGRSARAISSIAGQLGGLGVALFFAISGYLITTLLLREQEESGRISLRGFYLRRAFRILPPAYAYLGFLFVVRASGWLPGVGQPGEFASAAFFFSNYWKAHSWYTSHFWSLSMEEHFYLLWPVAFAVFGRQGALRVAGLLIFATLFWRPWSLAHVHLPYPALQRTDMRLDSFLFAGVLAIAVQSQYRAEIIRVLTAGWFRLFGFLFLISAWVWALQGSAPAVGTLVESALLPALIVSMTSWPGSWLYRVLECSLLRWIGRISYGLYLWQQLFLVGGSHATLVAATRDFVPHTAGIFLVAASSYYAMERPLLALGRRLSRKVSHAPSPSLGRVLLLPANRRQVLCIHDSHQQESERCSRLREKI